MVYAWQMMLGLARAVLYGQWLLLIAFGRAVLYNVCDNIAGSGRAVVIDEYVLIPRLGITLQSEGKHDRARLNRFIR